MTIEEQTIQSWAKSNVIFLDANKRICTHGGVKKHGYDRIKALVMKYSPAATILNEMPISEAAALLKQHGRVSA